MATHSYRGVGIYRCDSERGRWEIETRFSEDMVWDCEHSAHAASLAVAHEIIDNRIAERDAAIAWMDSIEEVARG